MECSETSWFNDREYFQQFSTKAAELRIPLSGSINLTNRCNMKCIHCYLSATSEHDTISNVNTELETGQVISILDEITEAGCLYFLITGGEPLLRNDFGDIYSHAKKNGLLITVFTNGTLITDDIVELFSKLPPVAVEISLYGATPSTYEHVTGVPGSFKKCMSGIKQLLENKINIRLKTILMTCNQHEFDEIQNIADEFGVPFRFDASIFPSFFGNQAPLSLRVPPDAAIKKEFSNASRSQQWLSYYKKFKHLSISDQLYNCGAGITNFHIDPNGNLQPCLMTHHYQYNLLNGTFRDGWSKIISYVRKSNAVAAESCRNCEQRTLCGYCPAFFELEGGSEKVVSDYICEMGKLRFQFIRNNGILK